MKRIAPSRPEMLLFVAAVSVLAGLSPAGHAAQITIEEFTLSPVELAPGGAFEAHVKVKAEGVPLASFVLRTTEPMARDACPPAFSHYNAGRQLAYIPENGDVHLSDNGPHDLDPADRAFTIRVSTEGWNTGRYPLALFAHNRPAPGNHIVDHRRFDVLVEADKVRVVDMGKESANRFLHCAFEPAAASLGEPARLRMAFEAPPEQGVQVRQAYYVAEENVPPSFTYDSKAKTGFLCEEGNPFVRDNGPLDANAGKAVIEIPLDTKGWRPGLYYFGATSSDALGRTSVRHLSLKIADPADQFDVAVSPSWPMIPGTHPERMTRLANGTLLHTSYLSTDNGKTWQKRSTGAIGSGSEELRNGTILGMGYRSQPIDGREGWYRGDRYVSKDGGLTVDNSAPAEFHVPQAKPAHGHAFHPGPLFMRSIVERPDGSLVALMAGWFKGDDEPCPYNPKRPYSRTYTCESSDGGKTWEFLSTIGYDHIGSEGYNEGSMKTLPDGRLIAVLRTGSMKDPKCHDNPIMVSVSEDGGKTWAEPWRSGLHGAFPDVIVLWDGVLALSYGRPGAGIAFSTDNGKTWTDHTSVDATPYSGYTSMREIAPGEILFAFGTRDRVDPDTGDLSDGIRLATVRYHKKGQQVDQLAELEQAGARVINLGDGFFEGEVTSKALGRPERFALYVPQSYNAEREQPYPLIVFLHGAGRHHRTLIDLPEAKAILEQSSCVILMPNGRGSWWIDSPVLPESRYEEVLAEQINLATEHLNVSEDPNHRAIGGWSMGGFGSVNYLENHPEQFGTWAGVIPLVDFPNASYDAAHNHAIPSVLSDPANWPAFNPINRADTLRGKNLYFVTATDAFEHLMNEAFAAKLDSLSIEHRFEILDGAHTIDVVLEALPKAMAFCWENVGR